MRSSTAILFFVLVAVSGYGQETAESPSAKNSVAEAEREPGPRHSSNDKLKVSAASRLVSLQHDDGAWPYEGVYRVGGKIPVGYRIGGTSIVCSALISVGLKDRTVIENAIAKGAELILKELDEPLMKPSRISSYDVRIWGHIYALDFFCRLKQAKGFDELKSKTNPLIQDLADAVVFQEIKGGGWNYSTKAQQCCFVTAPAVQSLLLAKASGAKVPVEVFERSLKVLSDSRGDDGIYPYIGSNPRGNTAPGSIARGPITEATLLMLGAGDQQQLQLAIDAFHEHWDELEKRRKKTGTHLPPHGIAPYYFYYGHRYAAQAIRMLPKEKQAEQFSRFESVLMKTKDSDDTWNDRVFEQSKAYGTAMSLMALSGDSVVLPPAIKVSGDAAAKDEAATN